MAYRRIVLATDGSASAETAERVAASLASTTGAKLTIAHAYTNPERAGEDVARAVRIAEREGATHEVALSAEAPADAILTTASDTDTELIVGDRSHIWLNEGGAPASLAGATMWPVPTEPDGTLDPARIAAAIRRDDVHFPRSGLICLENSHNFTGGQVLAPAYTELGEDLIPTVL